MPALAAAEVSTAPDQGHYWTFLTTFLAAVALARTLVPPEWISRFQSWATRLVASLDPQCTFTFPEYSGTTPDQYYDMVKVYLGTKDVLQAKRILVNFPKNGKTAQYSLADGEVLQDEHLGVSFEWIHHVHQRTGTVVAVDTEVPQETRKFEMRVHHRSVHLVQQYVQHISAIAEKIQEMEQELQIFTNQSTYWEEQPFSHPSNFDTLALDAVLKQQVKDRLTAFRADGDYFARTGRAQKLGFLLHGPPGTGKSSFIAAVANFMHYDIYDLDLSSVNDNATLRSLLTCMSNKAVVVVEDIDTANLPDRRDREGSPKAGSVGKEDEVLKKSGPTLGGMLNFTDGLQSSSGSERIFIFTTNHPERLDPALTRPGRCDIHVNLSYCTVGVLRHLCSTYTRMADHELLAPISELLKNPKANITPSQAAGFFDAHRNDPAAALRAVQAYLQEKCKQV